MGKAFFSLFFRFRGVEVAEMSRFGGEWGQVEAVADVAALFSSCTVMPMHCRLRLPALSASRAIYVGCLVSFLRGEYCSG